jgi:hypothetical protein
LSDELVLLFKSKKHTEKMPELVQQTFVYRRSIIENDKRGFVVLLDDFRFLTDIKNVNNTLYEFLILKFIFKLETEFSLLINKPASRIKSTLQKIMIALWEYLKISNTVNYFIISYFKIKNGII